MCETGAVSAPTSHAKANCSWAYRRRGALPQLPHRPRQEVVLYYYLFKTTPEYVAWKTEHRKRKEAAEADRCAAYAWAHRMFFAFNPVTRTLPLHFAYGSRYQGGRGDHFRSRSDRRRGRKQEEEGRHRWRRHQTHAQLPPLRRDVPVRRDRRSGGRATRWADPPVYVRPVPRLLEEIRRTFVVRQLTEVRADDG